MKTFRQLSIKRAWLAGSLAGFVTFVLALLVLSVLVTAGLPDWLITLSWIPALVSAVVTGRRLWPKSEI